MAISILNEPTTFEPVYNILKYRVQSTNSASTGFKYIYDIYIDGVLVTRVSNPPAPDGYGYIDVSDLVQSYVTSDVLTLYPGGDPGYPMPNSYIQNLQVKFGEQVLGAITPDLATSTSIYPFNGALVYQERADYTQADYVMDSNSTRKFLTNMPRTITLTRTQTQWLTFLRAAIITDYNDKFRVMAYDESGSHLFEWIVDYDVDTLNAGGRIIRIPIGYPNLGSVNSSFVTGDDWSDFLAPEVSYYTVALYNSNDDLDASELFTIRFKDDICRFTPKEIFFQNKFGAFETFVFQLVSTEKLKSQKDYYIKANPISQLNYRKTDRKETVLNVSSQTEYTALSNWITEEESRWLTELIDTSVAFLRVDDGLIPISITTDDYDVLTQQNKKLFNLSIRYRLTTKNDYQRG